MAGGYDGSIRIDTLINTLPLNSGLNKIESKVKALASTIGLAFGAKELIGFGKNAIDAASDLTEAQNVVDTAFGSMSYKMEQFAALALDTYGISELTAKNMGSTYMAMAKGMGVATDAASDMAVTLTGRLADIMSFYNKTQEQVDTIGRSLITGETEPLKAIGVVMTQTNLSAYAMAQGFSKTYSEMSANEQLLVRYKYFLEQTAMAQGDFSDTSESWANQTKLLSERIREFMTNLGSVLINIFTPAIQFANEAVMFLNELFFGSEDVEDTTAVKNAEAVADEVTAVGTAAEKSEKKLNNLLSGFDELHIISGADKKDDDTADAGVDTSNLLGVDLSADAATAKKAAGKYRDIINEIYLAFKRHPLTRLVGDIIKKVGEFFGIFEKNGDIDAGGVVTTLMNILGAILAFGTISSVIGGISTFSTGLGGLISLIVAHPAVAAVAGLTALAIGIYALGEEMERQRISSHFGDISISLEEMRELVNPITEDIDKVAKAFDDNKEKLDNAKDNFIDIAEAVQQTADAFKNGDLEQNVEGFAKQLDELLDSALEVNSATFDTSAWREAFLADDGVIDEHEQEILDSFSEMESSVGDTIRDYGAKIHEITQAAIDESRALTESEIANLESLYNKLAEMTLTQDQLKSEATWEQLKRGAYTYDSYAELAEQIKAAQEQEEKTRSGLQRSMYEDAFAKLNTAKAAGELTDEEYERQKAMLLKEADDTVREMDIKSKRYQRDVILAFAEGAVTNLAKAKSSDPQEIKKMQNYFKMMQSIPEGVDVEDFFSGLRLDPREVELFYYVKNISDDMEKHFGMDFASEWERLNEEIGDSAYSLDDFYSSLEGVFKNIEGIDVDDLLPKLEELKEYPAAYANVLTEYIKNADYSVTLGIEFDTEQADKDIENYISNFRTNKRGAIPVINQLPSLTYTEVSGQQRDIAQTININIDNENREQLRVFGGSDRTFMINNGKTRGNN